MKIFQPASPSTTTITGTGTANQVAYFTGAEVITSSAALGFNGTTLTVVNAPLFSAMTSGSVLFAGTAGVLSQDNSKFFYDGTNHHLIIGATSDSFATRFSVIDTVSANPVYFAGLNSGGIVTAQINNLSSSGSATSGFQFLCNGTTVGYVLGQANNTVSIYVGASGSNPPAVFASSAIDLNTKITTYNGITTVKNGVPSELATIDSTGLTANVGASTLYVVPSTGEGMYRVSAYLVTTTAGSISSTMPNAQIVFTDKDSNTSVTLDVSPVLGAAGLGQSGLLTANTVGTVFSGTVPFYVKASTTIQYQTVNYASTAAGMTYALRMRLEAL